LKELLVRSITGAIIVVVLLGSVLLGPWTFFIVYGILGVLALIEYIRVTAKHTKKRAILVIGFLYVLAPFLLLTQLVYTPYQSGYRPEIMIFLLMTIWIFDTGAYLVGRVIGKHPLSKKISPKKTWEGLFGGIFIAAIGIWLFIYIEGSIPDTHLWIMGGSIVVFGTLGDLIESAWKRSLGIKDSGKILPGHGGLLDRFDSMLLAIPFVWICLVIIN